MPTYLLCHRHDPDECRFAFAAWQGFMSPLRHRSTIGGCPLGDHRLWWTVDAADLTAALTQLPPFLADRTETIPVQHLPIP